MGSIIKRKKQGPFTVTRNLTTGKTRVSTSTGSSRKPGTRITRSVDSSGKQRTTTTTNYGGGLFRRTVRSSSGSGRRRGSGGGFFKFLSNFGDNVERYAAETKEKPSVKSKPLSNAHKIIWICIVMAMGIPLAFWSKWVGVIFMSILILPVCSDMEEK